MARLASFTRLTLLCLSIGTGLAAQEGWTGAFKFGGGPTAKGNARTYLGDAGFSMGAGLEAIYTKDKDSAFVFGLAYRFYPGDGQASSDILPSPLPNANAVYTVKVDKNEARGWELSAMYRRELAFEGFYAQGGVVLSILSISESVTGSTYTYKAAPAPATAPTLAITALADSKQKSSVSFQVKGGIGYRLSEIFSVEANAFTYRLAPLAGSAKTGLGSEICLGIRF